jgi:hypothetical protein
MKDIRYWVDAALEANRRDHTAEPGRPGGEQTGPVRSSRALGMVLVAMHDAHAAVSGDMAPYHATRAAPGGLSARAAMAAAGYTVLSALYPGQAATLGAAWQYWANAITPGAASIAFGTQIGDDILAWRAGDAAFLEEATPPAAQAYDHDVDPLHPGQGFLGTQWGGAPRFLVPRQGFAPPPGADGAGGFVPGEFYRQEYAEVLTHGRETSLARTPDQEEIGIFWGYDGATGLGTPPRLYMQVVLTVLDGFAAQGAEWLRPRRLLEAVTAVAVAMADSGIQAWHYKYSAAHMLWRPVLAIRNAPAAVPGILPDPTWRPLGAPQTNQTDPARLASTPGFPAYPSGHATFGAAAFEVLRRFIRHHDNAVNFDNGDPDPIGFTFVSDEFDGRNTDLRTGAPRPRVARRYESLWEAIVDNSESRIWLGVHWRFDGISRQVGANPPEHGRPEKPGQVGPFGGVRLGLDIAKVLASERGFA